GYEPERGRLLRYTTHRVPNVYTLRRYTYSDGGENSRAMFSGNADTASITAAIYCIPSLGDIMLLFLIIVLVPCVLAVTFFIALCTGYFDRFFGPRDRLRR